MPILLITPTGNKQGQKMGQPPHERTNHGDFHTHRQMKMKIKIDKNTDQHGQGKDTKQKIRKRIEQNWSLEFFSRPNTFQTKLTNKKQPRLIRIITKLCG